jgi:hypothetical protein
VSAPELVLPSEGYRAIFDVDEASFADFTAEGVRFHVVMTLHNELNRDADATAPLLACIEVRKPAEANFDSGCALPHEVVGGFAQGHDSWRRRDVDLPQEAMTTSAACLSAPRSSSIPSSRKRRFSTSRTCRPPGWRSSRRCWTISRVR